MFTKSWRSSRSFAGHPEIAWTLSRPKPPRTAAGGSGFSAGSAPGPDGSKRPHEYDNIKPDDVFDGVVTRIEPYGVFVDIEMEREGLVHVSELSHEFIKRPDEAVSVGDKVPVKVLRINKRRKQVNLSIKALVEAPHNEEEEIAEEEEFIEEEEVEMSTTMAAAFDMFNTTEEPSSAKQSKPEKSKRNADIDALIQRTLKTQEDQS